jgi:hypothetical protein
VILPIGSVDRHLSQSRHKSSPPQGLILDEVYKGQKTAGLSENGELISKYATETSLNGQLCQVSISHDGDFATAVAIVPFIETLDKSATVGYSSDEDPPSSPTSSSALSNPCESTKWDQILAEALVHRPLPTASLPLIL